MDTSRITCGCAPERDAEPAPDRLDRALHIVERVALFIGVGAFGLYAAAVVWITLVGFPADDDRSDQFRDSILSALSLITSTTVGLLLGALVAVPIGLAVGFVLMHARPDRQQRSSRRPPRCQEHT
jgi:ABC-type phosphate transport system permease subunit